MWENMEEARKAALQAQALSTFCQQMCIKSEEDNVRIQKDIKKRLEIKVEDSVFWIGEAEARDSELKSLIDDLRCLEHRVKRAADNCQHNLRVDSESMAKITQDSAMPEVQCVLKALSEEAEMLRNAIEVSRDIQEDLKQEIGMMQNVGSELEKELVMKYEDLRVDKQSIVGLKRHSAVPEILKNEEGKVEENRVCKSHGRRIQTPPDGADANASIKSAAAQISSAKKKADKAANAMHKMTFDLEAKSNEVTSIIHDVIANAQQQKADLEHHLAMVDEQMRDLSNSECLLQRALEEKRKSACVLRGQLLVRRSEVKGQQEIDLRRMLERELGEVECNMSDLCGRQPQLQGAQRALRRSRLRMEDAIALKTSAIGIVQMKGANARDATKRLNIISSDYNEYMLAAPQEARITPFKHQNFN